MSNYPVKSVTIKELVDFLRNTSYVDDISKKRFFIPTDCEDQGFNSGYYDLGKVLHFLADMIEE